MREVGCFCFYLAFLFLPGYSAAAFYITLARVHLQCASPQVQSWSAITYEARTDYHSMMALDTTMHLHQTSPAWQLHQLNHKIFQKFIALNFFVTWGGGGGILLAGHTDCTDNT
jgi:hypothetical protein